MPVHRAQVRPSTADKDERTRRLYFSPIEHFRVDEVTHLAIDQWLADVRGRGKASRTAQMCKALLATAMQEAIRQGLVGLDPTKLAIRIRVPAPDPRYLTLQEARRLLMAARTQPAGLGVALAVHIGLRRGEILGLSVRDVDLQRGTIYVHQNLVRVRRGDGWALVLGPTKTARSRRRLPIPAGLASWMNEAVEQPVGTVAGRRSAGPHDPVVATATGGRMDPDNFSKAVARIGRQAGLDGVHPHLLRHTCATLLLDEGVDLAVVAAILGHSTVVLTANTYANVLDRTKREGIGLLDGLLAGGPDVPARTPAGQAGRPARHHCPPENR